VKPDEAQQVGDLELAVSVAAVALCNGFEPFLLGPSS
jgi:hypothetical protein